MYHFKLFFLFFIVLLCTFFSQNLCAQSNDLEKHLQKGDLLFSIEENDNPTTEVTKGINGYKVSHVAIFYSHQDSLFALEAIRSGVQLTPFSQYIDRHRKANGNLLLAVGKMKGDWQMEQSLQNAMQYIGKDYDSYFMPDDTQIYCSELVQKSYVSTTGKLLFAPIPMEFRNSTGEISQFWIDHYAEKGLSVPEGEAGSNPGNLSRSDKLSIWIFDSTLPEPQRFYPITPFSTPN